MTTAATPAATIGRIDRFASSRHLVGYLGLDPRSRQSGLGQVHTATSARLNDRRHVPCEAAHASMRSPGPLRPSANACANGATTRSRPSPSPQTGVPDLAAFDHAAGLHLRTARADVSQAAQLELAAGAFKRHNPYGSRAPATPDTPAQWATEREAALETEERYRASSTSGSPDDDRHESLDHIRRALDRLGLQRSWRPVALSAVACRERCG